MTDDPTNLGEFSGLARLFPLPELVMFPNVVQPLHIFEPRYRQLMADALDDDRLITMALLKGGWEEDYHNQPPIHPIVCVGKVFKEEKLADGRYNLLLQGLARARVIEELPDGKPYRVARVELLKDCVIADGDDHGLRNALGEALSGWFATHAAALEQMQKLLRSPLDLGALCDVFAFALPIDAEVKQELLAELDVRRRVERLRRFLETVPPPAGGTTATRRFPPEFSPN